MDDRLSRSERLIVVRLAAVFALRMLGLFLILPVFAEYARHLPGGGNEAAIGLAIGIYGLTQAVLLIPFGAASDRFGRKPVIVAGLALFVVGSLVAAFAPDLHWVTVGRALQGAGAISAAVTALVADLTPETHRTRAMAMIGSTIGLSFALSLVLGPTLYGLVGMRGIFLLTGVLAAGAAVMVWRSVPTPSRPAAPVAASRASLWAVLKDGRLLRLDAGVFSLHFIQMAMWVVVPGALVKHGALPLEDHWSVYLVAVLFSFTVMVPAIVFAERRGRLKTVYLASIALLAVVQLGFALWARDLWTIGLCLTAFFVAFNILEATQPSWVSRIASPQRKGAVLGVYNTLQSLGLFCGGWMGGLIAQHLSPQAIHWVAAGLALAWYALSLGLQPPARPQDSQSL
ncbi:MULTISPECIES: MFS transporter [Tepidiphilus]|uniref:MFS transporter n=1 Tax=Tepidiphilus baoligensis TaxID=2698687 RepID=A0ABX1QPG6_9PROT|nr:MULTISPECIES: MFS transporter [Tepidiphilus]NMH17115.1 MFS transporter [Tepidiphilus baoligensis]